MSVLLPVALSNWIEIKEGEVKEINFQSEDVHVKVLKSLRVREITYVAYEKVLFDGKTYIAKIVDGKVKKLVHFNVKKGSSVDLFEYKDGLVVVITNDGIDIYLYQPNVKPSWKLVEHIEGFFSNVVLIGDWLHFQEWDHRAINVATGDSYYDDRLIPYQRGEMYKSVVADSAVVHDGKIYFLIKQLISDLGNAYSIMLAVYDPIKRKVTSVKEVNTIAPAEIVIYKGKIEVLGKRRKPDEGEEGIEPIDITLKGEDKQFAQRGELIYIFAKDGYSYYNLRTGKLKKVDLKLPFQTEGIC